MPWITYDAFNFLNATLPKNIRVFEYGSGGSTLYWAHSLNARCVSVEDSPKWFSIISEYLDSLPKAFEVDYRLVPPRHVIGRTAPIDPHDPANYADDKTPGYSYLEYVSQIDEFPNDYFDVVIIDGRARPSCIVHSLDKVRPGGMIVFDNADRRYYFEHISNLFEGYDVQRFYGVCPSALIMTQTNIYMKLT